MISTAAVAQEAPATPATPPAATETAPAPSTAPAPASPAPSELPSTSADNSAAPVLSDAQAAALKNKVVWSSDQKNIGEVVDVVRDSSGRVTEMHADIGGFLGFGETRVRVSPGQFKLVNDRVELTQTEEQAENLPKVVDN
jgi:3-oxoacyl-ACP reductase-like protein